MKEYQEKFIEIAIKSGALEFGSFTLKSGRQSPYFFNASKMLTSEGLSEIADCYIEAIEESSIKFDSIFGPAYKGIFLASVIGAKLKNKNIPIAFDRKELKNHGEGGKIIGLPPTGNVLIIDDVLSAGTAARESIENIKSINEVKSLTLIIGLDRQEKGLGEMSSKDELMKSYNVKVFSVINLDTLITFSSNHEDFKKYKSKLDTYRSNWGA